MPRKPLLPAKRTSGKARGKSAEVNQENASHTHHAKNDTIDIPLVGWPKKIKVILLKTKKTSGGRTVKRVGITGTTNRAKHSWETSTAAAIKHNSQ